MKLFLSVLSLIFLTGCVSYNEFAQRKYLKGHFYDRAERYPPAHLKTNEKTSIADTFAHPSIDPDALCVVETDESNSPVLYSKNNNSVKKKILSPREVVNSKKVFSSEKNILMQEHDPERSSRRAFLFGILSLICMPFIITVLFSYVFSFIALSNANRVLKNPEASREQIKRAKAGKTMAIIPLAILGVGILLIILFFTLFPNFFVSGE